MCVVVFFSFSFSWRGVFVFAAMPTGMEECKLKFVLGNSQHEFHMTCAFSAQRDITLPCDPCTGQRKGQKGTMKECPSCRVHRRLSTAHKGHKESKIIFLGPGDGALYARERLWRDRTGNRTSVSNFFGTVVWHTVTVKEQHSPELRLDIQWQTHRTLPVKKCLWNSGTLETPLPNNHSQKWKKPICTDNWASQWKKDSTKPKQLGPGTSVKSGTALRQQTCVTGPRQQPISSRTQMIATVDKRKQILCIMTGTKLFHNWHWPSPEAEFTLWGHSSYQILKGATSIFYVFSLLFQHKESINGIASTSALVIQDERQPSLKWWKSTFFLLRPWYF